MSDSKKRDFNLLRLESDRFFLRGTMNSYWKRVVAWDKSGCPVEGVGGGGGGGGGRGRDAKLSNFKVFFHCEIPINFCKPSPDPRLSLLVSYSLL